MSAGLRCFPQQSCYVRSQLDLEIITFPLCPVESVEITGSLPAKMPVCPWPAARGSFAQGRSCSNPSTRCSSRWLAFPGRNMITRARSMVIKSAADHFVQVRQYRIPSGASASCPTASGSSRSRLGT